MGKAKVVTYCNDRYKGSLDDDACNKIEQVLYTDSVNEGLHDLAHLITCAYDSEVTQLIEDMECCGVSMHDFDTTTVGTLKNYQTCGVALMYFAKNCILGDSVGLGKTVETAGLYRLLCSDRKNEVQAGVKVKRKNFRALMLTEKNLASQFRTEMVKFTSEYFELIPSAEKAVMDKFLDWHSIDTELDYSIVGTHGLLSNTSFLMWLEQCRTQGAGFPFDLLVVDESSCLGNTKTQMTKNFKAISKYFDRIVFLNATPFETKLDIFYNQLNLLDPALLPTKEKFTKEYCIMDYRGMYPKATGKYKNQAQFKQLVGYRYFARTRRDKGATMEDCDGKIILSKLSAIQKEWLSKSQLHRVVYDCPNHLDPHIEFNSENVPKLASLTELFKNECSDANSILIYVYYKEAQKYLSKWLTNKGYSNRVLNGDTSYSERLSAIDGFKRGDYKVLITNVQKGLNFGSCDYCIFYSFDPNPSKMVQFEGRTTRDFDIIGKHIYILCSDGAEYKKFNDIVRPRAKATTELTNSDISVVMNILTGIE